MGKNSYFFNYIGTAVLLMALWFVMSGRTEIRFLLYGAASSLLIAGFCVKPLTMKGVKTGDTYFVLRVNIIRLFLYSAWLVAQIAKSAVYVSRLSFADISNLEPSIAWFKADYDNPAARAMLANSITLTPGTITVDITEGGIYSVHTLNEELKDGLLNGALQNRIAWLYGEKIDFSPLSEGDIPAERLIRRIKADAGRYKAGRKKA